MSRINDLNPYRNGVPNKRGITPKVFKACPFCGFKNYELESFGGAAYRVLCKACQASGPLVDTEAEAITAWNLRG